MYSGSVSGYINTGSLSGSNPRYGPVEGGCEVFWRGDGIGFVVNCTGFKVTDAEDKGEADDEAEGGLLVIFRVIEDDDNGDDEEDPGTSRNLPEDEDDSF